MGSLIGYARISTADQSPDLQEDALKKAGCIRVFVDQASGVADHRPELERLLDHLRPGDSVVVWRLDRLARSLRNLIELVRLLEEKQVGLKSLQESIDTSTPGGKLIFHVFGALAEFERELIRERTKARAGSCSGSWSERWTAFGDDIREVGCGEEAARVRRADNGGDRSIVVSQPLIVVSSTAEGGLACASTWTTSGKRRRVGYGRTQLERRSNC